MLAAELPNPSAFPQCGYVLRNEMLLAEAIEKRFPKPAANLCNQPTLPCNFGVKTKFTTILKIRSSGNKMNDLNVHKSNFKLFQ